jgi:hypothetical protein
MQQLQLPKFQPHPECATALLTLDQAIALLQSGDLSITAAQWLFPQAQALLPQMPSKG